MSRQSRNLYTQDGFMEQEGSVDPSYIPDLSGELLSPADSQAGCDMAQLVGDGGWYMPWPDMSMSPEVFDIHVLTDCETVASGSPNQAGVALDELEGMLAHDHSFEAAAKDDLQTLSFCDFSSPEASSTSQTRRRSHYDLKFQEVSFSYPGKDEYIQDGCFLCPPGYENRSGDPCTERFKTARDRNKHIRKHVKPVLCRKCPVRMAAQRDMSRHMKIHKKNRERFQCDMCDESCARYDLLERHVRTRHFRKLDQWKARNTRPPEKIRDD